MGIKGDRGLQGLPGPPGPRGPPGEKGAPGQSISAPSLLQPPVQTTVNKSQTAILKCTAVGNPPPRVTWSKVNSTLPVGRHVVESSGALILQDITPEDEGQYTCKAENLLGSINASARLTVQCKLRLFLQDFFKKDVPLLNEMKCFYEYFNGHLELVLHPALQLFPLTIFITCTPP